jgi:hypothetical protein
VHLLRNGVQEAQVKILLPYEETEMMMKMIYRPERHGGLGLLPLCSNMIRTIYENCPKKCTPAMIGLFVFIYEV